MMTDEAYQAALKAHDNDPALLDELLAGLQAAARGEQKAQLGQARMRFREKAAQPRQPPDIFDSVSQWLTAGGDPRCL